MIGTDKVLTGLEKRTAVVNHIVTVVMPIALVIGGYYWFMEHAWKPSVVIDNVDWLKGQAAVTINGTTVPLYPGSVLDAKHGWGVTFAGKNFGEWDRIELTKNGMTKKTLSKK